MEISKLHAGGIPAQPQTDAANNGQSETAAQNQFNSQYGTPYAKVPFAAKPLGQLKGPFKLATQENVQAGADGSFAPFAATSQTQETEPPVADPQTHENAVDARCDAE